MGPGAGAREKMADFIQSNVTKSAVCEFANPIADNGKNKKPGPTVSGEPGTGVHTATTGETRKAARSKAVPCQVERATTLRVQSIARPKEPKSTLRRRTQQDIYGKDPEIPYVKFESVARDLVCSLMERQDRMNEEIFYKLNDLVYRIEDLEQGRTGEGGAK